MPLVEVGGEVRTLPDEHARVVVRGGSVEATWRDGVRAVLRARAEGRGWRVDCSVSSRRAVSVGAIGVRILGLSATRVLVDGYHSWDWAGVREVGSGFGWWGGVFGVPGGPQVAVALDAPPRLGPLLLRWNPGGPSLGAFSVGAPPQLSHATGEPPSLHVPLAAGGTLRGDPVRIAPLDRRSPWGAGLPRLRMTDHRPAPRLTGWMSWNCLGPSASAGDVLDAAHTLVPVGGVALLDDGWMPRWGDWLERTDFGSSLADLAAAVRQADRRFGLWVAPFLVDPESQTAVQQRHLLLCEADGEPIMTVRAPRPHYVLDASLPGTRQHLQKLGRRLGLLGVDVLKVDFLFAGALPGRRTTMSDIAALRAGVAALVRGYRAAAPRGARVLACGAPAPPLVGLADACRSGDDSVANVPPAGVEPPPRPWFVHGEALRRAQERNLTARAWLWGATLPPDVDAVTLGAVGDTPAVDDAAARRWLDLAVSSGGPLLDSDAPGTPLAPARLRMLRRAYDTATTGRPPRPARPHDALHGSAVAEDNAGFHAWPDELPGD